MQGTPTERATLLITVTAATVAFALGFNLGAFDAIFFDALLTVWVVATVVLVGSFVTSLPPKYVGGRLVLLLPSGWLLAALVSDPAGEDAASRALFGLTIAVTVVCLPFIAWALISAINPEFIDLPRLNRVAVVGAVVAFALIGYGLGARNDLFLSCDDFKISGNDLPGNCTSGPDTANPGS
jgi:uncharacterized membrane protein